jgi:hypothetical protein
MLDSRLHVLRKLQQTQTNERITLNASSKHGVVEVAFVALREDDNALVVRRHGGALAFVPLDFVRASWREERPHGTRYCVRVTRVGWRRLVYAPRGGRPQLTRVV